MRAADVMTRCPVSVTTDTPLRTIAAILSGNGISAVPVLDERGRPVGVVSEIDLIRAGARTRRDLDGCRARELMSTPVVTVPAGEPLPAAARRLSESGVRRLFVVDVVESGRLVGVLSRRDLLRGYLRADDDIRIQVEYDVRALLTGASEFVNVTVRDGEVLLLGRVGWHSELAPVTDAASAVPGVVAVRNRMGFFFDDGTAPARRPVRSAR